MAGKSPIKLPSVPQHIVQFGHNRKACFRSERDYARYLEYLHHAAITNHIAIHAYLLLPDQVHLLVTPDNGYGIGHMMQDTSLRYACHLNTTQQGTRLLLDGRYKTTLVDNDAWLLTSMRYIETKPVRKGLVHNPAEYRWSSYQSNALGKYDSIVETHPAYERLGASRLQRQLSYRKLIDKTLDYEELSAIRKALNQVQDLRRDYVKEEITTNTRQQSQLARPIRPSMEEGEDKQYLL